MAATVQNGLETSEVSSSSDPNETPEQNSGAEEADDSVEEKEVEGASKPIEPPPLVEEQIRWLASCIAFPGQFMHQDWWKSLGLAAFEQAYKATRSLSFRAAIDRSIWSLYDGNPPDWSGFLSFSAGEEQLLSWRSRLEVLVLAAALELTGHIEYLLRKTYRTQLMEYFSPKQLQQLSIIWRGRTQLFQRFPPEQLIPELRALGEYALLHATPHKLLWKVLKLERPVAAATLDKSALSLGRSMKWKRFVQLGRWLR